MFKLMLLLWLGLGMGLLLTGSAAPGPAFTSYTHAFDVFEARTRGMETSARVAAFRKSFDTLRPGLYADTDSARLDRRIAAALAEFPAIRESYRAVEHGFPLALATAVQHFRTVFPDFVPPLPIILAHELGVRDGGSDEVGDRKVMLFGADMIAKLHNDDSLQPFLDHELFHLEHARHFADCDQFWCPLWQEGLATFAAARMTPNATDHQLLLDQPAAIRAMTDANLGMALCLVARDFDNSDSAAIPAAFMVGRPPPRLPSRFGYYIGMLVATEAAKTRPLKTLAMLDDEQARPVVVAALTALMAAAHAPCAPPHPTAAVTHIAARPA